MTRVDLSAVAREFGDVPVDAVATVRVQGWAGARPAATVDGAAVVFSPRNEVIVQGDTPGQAIDLVPTDGTFCYRWDVSTRSGSLKLPTRYTLVPTSGPVAFGDLVDVDPESFEPTPDVVAAWEAAIGEVETLRDETLTAAGTAQGHATAAAGSAGAAATSAGQAASSAGAAANSATQAGNSATDAATSADTAGTARDEAVTARDDVVSEIRSAAVAVRTSDGQYLPAGAVVLITIDKTLAQVTASPVADIADITFQTGA